MGVEDGGADVRAWEYDCDRGGEGGALRRRSWEAEDTGGLLGDFARSALSLDGGLVTVGGRGGTLLLRMMGGDTTRLGLE